MEVPPLLVERRFSASFSEAAKDRRGSKKAARRLLKSLRYNDFSWPKWRCIV
jgi:hypothetical protein